MEIRGLRTLGFCFLSVALVSRLDPRFLAEPTVVTSR